VVSLEEKLKFHHFGIATDNISSTLEYLNTMFEIKNISETIFDEKQNVNLCMVTLKDEINMELINGEIINNYLRKNVYFYHICYETNNFECAIEKFVKNGAVVISEPKEAVLFNNKKVAFLFTQLGLIELLEM